MNFDCYEIGKQNKLNKEISDIVFRAEGKYVIYKCKDDPNINFDGSDDILTKISGISQQLAKIEILTHNKEKDYEFTDAQLVYAISTAAEGNTQEANDILKKLESKIICIEKNKGRLHYLLGSFCMLVIIILLMSIVFFIGMVLKDGVLKQIIFILKISTLGGLGGFLSVATKLNELEVSTDSGMFINISNGVTRVIISIISSVLIYFLIKSNLILGAISKESADIYHVFAIISGFSEKFVPNIFNKIETDTINKSTNISG